MTLTDLASSTEESSSSSAFVVSAPSSSLTTFAASSPPRQQQKQQPGLQSLPLSDPSRIVVDSSLSSGNHVAFSSSMDDRPTDPEEAETLSTIDEELVIQLPATSTSYSPKDDDDTVVNEDDEEGPPHLALLPEDTFSFLVFSQQAVTLTFAGVTMGFQLATLSILIADVIDFQQTVRDDDGGYFPNNILGIPAAVNWEVVVAQLFALVSSLLSNDDILWALNIFINGYNHQLVLQALAEGVWSEDADNKKSSNKGNPTDHVMEVEKLIGPATYERRRNFTTTVDQDSRSTRSTPRNLRRRWHFANSARFLVGCLSLSATFMLIVRSETVLDVLLNFTAIEFISQIDNGVFALAKWGYLGDKMKADARHQICDNAKHSILHNYECRCTWHFVCNTMVRVFLGIFIIGCWSWVLSSQNHGRFLNREIYVQMGDASNLNLGTFSGIYVRTDRRRKSTRRFAWVAKLGHGELTYCMEEGAWIFRDLSLLDDRKKPNLHENECGWILRSAESASYNVLSTRDTPWIIQEDFNVEIPVDKMLLVSYNSEHKPGGQCASKTAYGLNCEFDQVCPILSTDARRPDFVSETEVPTKFWLLDNLEVYERPVYWGQVAEDQAPFVLFFSGRRWIIASTVDYKEELPFVDEAAIRDKLQNFRVHTFSRLLGTAFISAPVDVGTSSNAVTPENVEWFEAEAEHSSDVGRLVNIDTAVQVTTTLLCAVCDEETNPCFFDSPCHDNRCQCDIGADGTLCEVPPTGNGYCNTNFNRRTFSFDSGDCCMTACQNSARFSCGKAADGFNDVRNVECNQKEAAVGWGKVGKTLTSMVAGASGFGDGVALSSEGTSLFVGATGGDGMLSILRQNGSEWVNDFLALEVPSREKFVAGIPLNFGRRIFFHELLPNSISNSQHVRALSVVVSGHVPGESSYLFPFTCRSGSCFAIMFFAVNLFDFPSDITQPYLPTAGVPRQNFTSVGLFWSQRLFSEEDITNPGAFSPDRRYMCAGGGRLVVFEFGRDPRTRAEGWYEVFTLHSPGGNSDGRAIVRYVDMSFMPTGSRDGNNEYLIAVGLKRMRSSVDLPPSMFDSSDFFEVDTDNAGMFDEAPLEVRVFRWVAGGSQPPQQVGTTFVSDLHLVGPPSQQNAASGAGRGGGEGMGGPGAPPRPPPRGPPPRGGVLRMPLRDSVRLSLDGTVLLYSSYFFSTPTTATTLEFPLPPPVAINGVNNNNNSIPGRGNSNGPPFSSSPFLEARVIVRYWNGTDWALRHTFVLGPQTDPSLREGWTTSMSSDGSTLAIGTGMHVTVYQWDGTTYVNQIVIGRATNQVEAAIPSLALSGDGASLAIGNPQFGITGTVDIYQNDRYTPCKTSGGDQEMHLSFTTGGATLDTWWRVVQHNETLREGGPGTLRDPPPSLPANTTFVFKECFSECSNMTLTSWAQSPRDEGTMAAYFQGTRLEVSTDLSHADCVLQLLWSSSRPPRSMAP